MQIDWPTVAAQIVNFLILVWLLKHFLYGPIIRAMSRREQGIADRLGEADRRTADADAEAERYRSRLAALEQARERMLAEARDKAEAEGKALSDALKEEIEAERRDWNARIADERSTFLGDLRERTATQFTKLARQALHDLADADLEVQMTARFVDRLKDLDPDAVAKMTDGLGNDQPLVVRSRFTLPADAQERVTEALHAVLGADRAVAFETDETTAGGLVLVVGDHAVAWTMDHYLDDLERNVSDLLSRAPGADQREAAA
ncbi:MAG: hypothetical protein CMM50_18280 [Rhodospirillaceae bacterium]|nr:hypothetical protein [Rhodospirillaceae bacterium]